MPPGNGPLAPLTLELHLEPLAGFACCSRALKGGQLAYASEHFQLEEGLLALPRTGLAPHLPPVILCDAEMRPLAFPRSFGPGVDGLPDGHAEMPNPDSRKERPRRGG